MILDMTTGSPLRKILRFFIPVLLGSLLQQMYNMADSVIVSRYIGVDAFAGVSATGSLNFLIIGFTMGLCSGFAIPISQEFGAGDHRMMRSCFANAIYTATAFAVVIAVVTAILTPDILRLVGTPEDIFAHSQAYIRIIFAGIPATVFYNLFAGSMRSVGDSRTPLIMLVVSCLLNIGLDILFIMKFRMGVAGAAVATILAQIVSVVLCTVVIFGEKSSLRIRDREWQVNVQVIRRLIRNGVPMGLQFSITAVGSTILQSAVNGLGSGAVASIGAGAKVYFLLTTPAEAIGATMATYAGQNIGAKKIGRVRKGVRQTTLIMAIYSAAAFIAAYFVGDRIAKVFIDSSEIEILANVKIYLNIVFATVFLLVIVLVYRNAIQGMGYGRIAMLAGLLELCGRLFVASVFVKHYGYTGACFANPAAWLCADVFLLPTYFGVVRRCEKRFGQNDIPEIM